MLEKRKCHVFHSALFKFHVIRHGLDVTYFIRRDLDVAYFIRHDLNVAYFIRHDLNVTYLSRGDISTSESHINEKQAHVQNLKLRNYEQSFYESEYFFQYSLSVKATQ